jgi:hypothetical protein
MAKYLLYVLRWTVLAIPGALFFNQVRQILDIQSVYVAMVISQALMGAMVYFVDKWIFTSGAVSIPWEIKPKAICVDCGRRGTCYRPAGAKCCEATSEECSEPRFRCEECSVKRLQ